MDPVTLSLLASGAGGVLNTGFSMYGNSAKADAARAAANQQMAAENKAYGIGSKYYTGMENAYAPGAARFAGDDASWRAKINQGPAKLGDFDASKYNVDSYLDPSMAFQQQQMSNAVNQGAAARGGMFAGSGATAKALQDRSSALAQTDYGNAWNRMSSDRQFGKDLVYDKYNADRTFYSDDVGGAASLRDSSNAERQGMFDAQGGAADLGMAHERSLGDIMAGKARISGDLTAANMGSLGNLASSIGGGVSSYYANKGTGVSGLMSKLGVDPSKMTAAEKQSLLQSLISGSK